MASKGPNRYEDSLIRQILKGLSQRQAFKASLYKSDSMPDDRIDTKASAILKREHVKSRLSQLQKKLKDKLDEEAIITVADVLIQIKSLLETDIEDIAEIKTIAKVERDGKGEVIKDMLGDPIIKYDQEIIIKDMSQMSKAAKRSISEIGYDANGRLKVKRYSKKDAIDQAGRYLKMFTDKLEIKSEIKQTVTIVEDI